MSTSTLKDNIRRLKWAVRVFGADSFYSVSANGYRVSMQGDRSDSLTEKCKRLGFKRIWEDQPNAIYYERGIYLIIQL